MQDPFGNYVVQYVLELGHPEATERIMEKLTGHYSDLAQQKFSSNVVEKCLKLGGPSLADARERVIRELIGSPVMARLLQVRLSSLAPQCEQPSETAMRTGREAARSKG